MKNGIISLVVLLSAVGIAYSHKQGTHQHIVREAYKLLEEQVPAMSISVMKDYVGTDQTDGPWTVGRIVIGAYREDEEDIVYGICGANITGCSLTTNTHFWNADNGDNHLSHLWDPTRGWADYENALQKANHLWFGTHTIFMYNGSDRIYKVSYENLVDLWKTGDNTLHGYYNLNGQWTGYNPPVQQAWDVPTRRRVAYEILGRICHLLGDMSVPAHVHNDPHWFGGDTYEEYMEDSGHYLDYVAAYNQGGMLFDVLGKHYPIRYLFYVTNQYSDHYPSNDKSGDNSYYSYKTINGLTDYYPILTEIYSTLGGVPSSINTIDQRNHLYPFIIRTTASLLFLFACETGDLNTTTSGTLTSNEMWSGSCTLTGSVTVPNGITLTILPGTSVKFGGSYQIIVQNGGKIIAEGISSNPILFTSTYNRWQNVKLCGGGNSLKYCIFEKGIQAIYLYNCNSGVTNVIENCEMKNNSYGIVSSQSKVKIKSCNLHDNSWGIGSYKSTQLDITATRIHHNYGYGVCSYSGGLVQLYGCVIEYNGSDGINTRNSDVINIGYPYTWQGKNTVRYNTGTEVYACSGSPVVRICCSSVHNNSGLEVYNYSGNSYAVSTLQGFWDTNGCQYQGNATLYSPNNYLPAWDGQTFTGGPLGKFIIDEDEPEYQSEEDRIDGCKKIIADQPDTPEAEQALIELYAIVRGDYIADKLGEKNTFYDFIEDLDLKHESKKLGKRALRYMIHWNMLENNNKKAIKLSKKALKNLDGEERMHVLEDLAMTYAYIGNISKACKCLDEIKEKYAFDEEGISFVENAIDEAEEMIRTGELLAKELIDGSEMISDDTFTLLQNYPNPGNPTTSIIFSLAEPRRVELKVFNILGQEVRSLVNDYRETGAYSVIWDGKNNQGREVPSGIYLYWLQAGEHVFTKKLTLLK